MTARTHDAVAFATLVTAATLSPPQQLNVLTIFIALVANVIGALMPDIDQATNRLWDLLPSGNAVGKELRKLFLHHRTITHSALGVFLAYTGFRWLLPRILNATTIDVSIVFWSLMIGYVSHLAADIVTRDGLPLLFPLQWSVGIPPIRGLRIRAGSWVETYIVLPAVGVYLVWFIWTHQIEVYHLIQVVRI